MNLKLQDMYKMNSNALAFVKVTSDWIKSLASLIRHISTDGMRFYAACNASTAVSSPIGELQVA